MGLRVEKAIADDVEREANENVSDQKGEHDRNVESPLDLILVNLVAHVVLGDKEHHCLR